MLLMALFRVKTVNLTEIATAFMGNAKTESNYKHFLNLEQYESNFGHALQFLFCT